MDTSYVQALYHKGDRYHVTARAWYPRARAAESWITESVLTEIGDGLSVLNRPAAAQFIRQAYRTPNLDVVRFDSELLDRALQLYQARPDKEWGLTDCISFVVREDHGLSDALTADHHFTQAGFRALLRQGGAGKTTGKRAIWHGFCNDYTRGESSLPSGISGCMCRVHPENQAQRNIG